MSAELDPERLRRLEQLLQEAEDPRLALERSELAEDPACRAALEELIAASEALDQFGGFEREEFARWSQEPPVASGRAEELFAAQVLAESAAPSSASEDSLPPRRLGPDGPRRRPALLGWLAAAAALMLVVLTYQRTRQPDNVPMSGDRELSAPTGVVDGELYGTFRWEVAPPVGGRVQVLVFDPDSPELAPLHKTDLLEGDAWKPDEALDRAWPDRIEWTLRVYDGTDPAEFTSYRASAQRSSAQRSSP